MSRIYFHSPSDEAEVRGSERAHAGWLCGSLLWAILDIEDMPERPSWIRNILPKGHYTLSMQPGSPFIAALETHVKVALGDDGFVLPDNRKVNPFTLALNTALSMGSDPIKLLARLHGQCEIHAFVEGPNRAWLAGIIEQGRTAGIMRADSGWESVITLLRSRDDEPVVTSYSVCEQFPNPGAADWTPPDDENGEPYWDAWYEMPEDKRWDIAMAGIRADGWLEMKPETWTDYYFRDGITGFTLRQLVDQV